MDNVYVCALKGVPGGWGAGGGVNQYSSCRKGGEGNLHGFFFMSISLTIMLCCDVASIVVLFC